MNISFVLLLLAPLASQPFCLHQLGCFRYSCADFSKDAVMILRHENITSYPVCGWTNHGRHVWVAVELGNMTYHIEPQLARIIHPSTIQDYAPSSHGYFFSRRCAVRGIA